MPDPGQTFGTKTPGGNVNSIAQLAAPRVRAPNAFSHFYRLWHSVPETPSYGTEGTLGAQNSLLWYATHFQKLAVLKTGFYGTEYACRVKNSLLWYATHFQKHSV